MPSLIFCCVTEQTKRQRLMEWDREAHRQARLKETARETKKERVRHRDSKTEQIDKQDSRHAAWQTDRRTVRKKNRQTNWQTGLETNTKIYRQTDRLMDRSTDKKTEWQTGKETDRKSCHWGQSARQVEGQTLAGFPGLTVGHVIEDVLHGPAVRQAAVRQLSVTLLPTLTLMSVKQEDELLLDQLPLLRVSYRRRHRLHTRTHSKHFLFTIAH